MQSLTHQFLAFCRSKPADEAYEYTSNWGCAFAQFVKETGICEDPDIGGHSWGPRGPDSRSRDLPPGVNDAVAGWDFASDDAQPDRTFGALTTRLEAALATVA